MADVSILMTNILSGRNEVIETSGRLHPLWPQNKWLHMPQNMDYRHTRQARWIQTELASTLAKNATNPNPFEIILLQNTRKENNWKTEETVAKAVVTLETEQIKGSNPWRWWWWWWLTFCKFYSNIAVFLHLFMRIIGTFTPSLSDIYKLSTWWWIHS